jgi:hypothetical protein
MGDVEETHVIKRRSQREECTVCGNRVAVRDDGSLRPHYRGEGGRIRWNNERRCPGGFDPVDDGTIRLAATQRTRYGTPLPSQGELSVRTVSGGLPSSGRRH